MEGFLLSGLKVGQPPSLRSLHQKLPRIALAVRSSAFQWGVPEKAEDARKCKIIRKCMSDSRNALLVEKQKAPATGLYANKLVKEWKHIHTIERFFSMLHAMNFKHSGCKFDGMVVRS